MLTVHLMVISEDGKRNRITPHRVHALWTALNSCTFANLRCCQAHSLPFLPRMIHIGTDPSHLLAHCLTAYRSVNGTPKERPVAGCECRTHGDTASRGDGAATPGRAWEERPGPDPRSNGGSNSTLSPQCLLQQLLCGD